MSKITHVKLIIREYELRNLTRTNNIIIIFLVETDTNSVNKEEDYTIPCFKRVIQNKKSPTDQTRIIVLIENSLCNQTTIRI